jgi:hypothetical protein
VGSCLPAQLHGEPEIVVRVRGVEVGLARADGRIAVVIKVVPGGRYPSVDDVPEAFAQMLEAAVLAANEVMDREVEAAFVSMMERNAASVSDG